MNRLCRIVAVPNMHVREFALWIICFLREKGYIVSNEQVWIEGRDFGVDKYYTMEIVDVGISDVENVIEIYCTTAYPVYDSEGSELIFHWADIKDIYLMGGDHESL